MMRKWNTLLYVVVCVMAAQMAGAQDWPEFLGPGGNNHSTAKNVPVTWSETENVTWKTPLHDHGWSSPVICGEQVWMTAAPHSGLKMYAICVDKNTGKILHDILVFENETTEGDDLIGVNTFASCTPCVEPGRVYVHFGTYGTACLDTKTGKKIWQRRDLNIEHFRGPGSSPILYGDTLIVQFDGADKQFMTAFDKKTGKTVWQTTRSFDFGNMDPDIRKGYCTPIVVSVDGKDQLVNVGAQAAYGYDAKTGEEIWRVRFNGFSNASRPVNAGEFFLLNTGYGRANLLAVRPGGKGDVSETHIAWQLTKAVPLKPTPMVIGGVIYMMDDRGIFSCVSLEDGELLWQKRIGGNFSATPLYADGKLYCFDEEGKCHVLKPAADEDEADFLAVNQLDAGALATPCAQDGVLFVRTKTHLYRIESAK